MSSVSDEELVQRFPDVVITGDNKAFYRGWLQRELILNQCAECGNWDAQHHPICPECWSSEVHPKQVNGRGTVYLLFWLERGPSNVEATGRAGAYPIATVELEEQRGLRYTSTVLDGIPGQLSIGGRVELAWITRHGQPYPVFVRDAESAGVGPRTSTGS